MTAFHVACNYVNVELIKLLLDDDRIDLNKKDHVDETGFNIIMKKKTNESFTRNLDDHEQIDEIINLLASNEKIDTTYVPMPVADKPSIHSRAPRIIFRRNGLETYIESIEEEIIE